MWRQIDQLYSATLVYEENFDNGENNTFNFGESQLGGVPARKMKDIQNDLGESMDAES